VEIILKPSSPKYIEKYIQLYRSCFPRAKHLSPDYLKWLYSENPLGQAIGADAWFRDDVVGQVIAIPGKYSLYNENTYGLLAVNVAVHSDFQGRYLFKKLGLCMCEYGSQAGYKFVIGVANRAATPGWIRQMGFQLVGPLQATIGLGNLSLYNKEEEILDATSLRHMWDDDSISWRLGNPLKKYIIKKHTSKNWSSVYTLTDRYGLFAVAEIPMNEFKIDSFAYSLKVSLKPKVFLGLVPNYKFSNHYINIPERFKPSPLNLIYKNLDVNKDRIDSSTCFINFLDFDVF
jgi:hypothetical protein